MPTTLPASRLPLPNAYLAGVLISALLAFILEGMAGFGDARTASAPVLIGATTLITVLFWPVFALCLNNLAQRRAPRALGGVLHVGCMVSLTLTGVSDAVPASLLPI